MSTRAKVVIIDPDGEYVCASVFRDGYWDSLGKTLLKLAGKSETLNEFIDAFDDYLNEDLERPRGYLVASPRDQHADWSYTVVMTTNRWIVTGINSYETRVEGVPRS